MGREPSDGDPASGDSRTRDPSAAPADDGNRQHYSVIDPDPGISRGGRMAASLQTPRFGAPPPLRPLPAPAARRAIWAGADPDASRRSSPLAVPPVCAERRPRTFQETVTVGGRPGAHERALSVDAHESRPLAPALAARWRRTGTR